MNHSPDSAVWQAFDHAAEHYDQASILQHQSAEFFLERIAQSGEFSQPQLQWMDAGCGTGVMAKQIAQQGQRVIAIDQSPAMLTHLQGIEGVTPIQGDIHHLPFADSSIDRLVSHFALHWLGPMILTEVCRVVKSAGMLWLAIPVQGSFASVHARYPELPIFDFLPAEAWIDAAKKKSVEIVSVSEKCWSQTFTTLQDLLHMLKLMGGHRLGRVQAPVPLATFRSWLRDVEPIALEYQVLYLQLRCL
ncbi:MAG: methyltransferase domain-containing protein [Gammaproteobacteria bacterium]|nr:methyltransferase domain-containing protein [Gammaproteobacteria bacterium]